jgi:hydrogenase maturation protease
VNNRPTIASAPRTANCAPRTIVVGLGNPILSDDGVGVLVARRAAEELRHQGKGVSVKEGSVGGLRLVEMLVGFDRAIIVDAIKSNPGEKPGTHKRMSLEDLTTLAPTQHSASTHDTSLPTAFRCGRRLGMRLPDDISIFAIEVENVTDFSEHLTPEVAECIPVVAAEVVAYVSGE